MTSTIHLPGSPAVSFCHSSLRLALFAAAIAVTPALAQDPTPATDAPAPAAAPSDEPAAATEPTTTTTAQEPTTTEPTNPPATTEPTPDKAPESEPPKAPERPKNVVTVNVPSNLFGAFSLELSRVLTDHVAVFVEPTFFLIGPQEGFSKGIFGPGLVVGTMIHPFGEAPDGLFLAPEFYVTRLDSLGDRFGGDLGLGAGGVFGYSMRFFDHLMVSLGLGATANLLGYNLAGERGFGVMPIIRANVGAAF